eukprot:TRINITY_DN17783_c0_g2_i1.p2 TRINITY_DN17783_c0_g2~~TRINITY_DN17783_c0_g2_i1.p2  ORF type:complete len:106 (+),score=14.42 TRINITY_DN17783_c0_g2_i1:209-526(+)
MTQPMGMHVRWEIHTHLLHSSIQVPVFLPSELQHFSASLPVHEPDKDAENMKDCTSACDRDTGLTDEQRCGSFVTDGQAEPEEHDGQYNLTEESPADQQSAAHVG